MYNPAEIEAKWQKYWLENKTFKAEVDHDKEKLYVLDMFPYPSGSGLHVGHPEGYTATDIFCRYKRMKGFNVLHPMGWDAFGLPAEQYAVETGTHPSVTTKTNIDNFRRQIQSLGFSYDWDREINTTDLKYYKWTQWIFCQLHKRGLAFIDEIAVNWCPELGTVLANEEVIDGRSERGNYPVVRQPMRQWVLKITDYAERLLDDLEDLDWPEGIKKMQRDWIGRSEGAEVTFNVDGSDDTITVYTTRPDTLFGATYMVLSPEHKLVDEISTSDKKDEIKAYQTEAAKMSDLDRTELNTEKTGGFIGAHAINPVNGEKIPIWISDYVLVSYGTGAIMAVPAHDSRDFEFAEKFDIQITPIIEPDTKIAAAQKVSVEDVLAGKACWTNEGPHINSANSEGLDINGMAVKEAFETTADWLEERGIGKRTINYKLRDWLFSRQRYWGEPFPIVHMEDGEIKLLDDSELPLELPPLENFKPSGNGESPLANATDWLDYTDPVTGKKGRRETNTMPQWAGSCWYYLRYIDPLNEDAAWDEEKEKYWLPVDLYVGGAEHAVLHLLYARFWHKVLYDIGVVSTKEPFQRLINQGMILGTSYKDNRGFFHPADKIGFKDSDGNTIEERAEGCSFFLVETGEALEEAPTKMSKSLKNVVNPDEVIDEYGADSFRLYEMFMGPLEASKPWNTDSVSGVSRFLNKAWRMIVAEDGSLAPEIGDHAMTPDQERILHQSIKKVDEDTASLDFNTAISQMMVFVNEFGTAKERNKDAMVSFVLMLSSYAPHIAEEFWVILGKEEGISYIPFPSYDESKLVVDEVEILLQSKGKPKARIMMSPNMSKEEMEKAALEIPEVQEIIDGKEIIKMICVPGRLINIVTKG